MVDVRIDTTVFAPSGYAYAARKLLLGLVDEGIKVSLYERKMDVMQIRLTSEETKIFNDMLNAEYSKDVPLLRYGTPPVFASAPAPDHKRNLLKFVWELDYLPPSWLNYIEPYDEYITNTEFCKQSIHNSLDLYNRTMKVMSGKEPIDKQIHIVPHGVDTKIYFPDKNDPLYKFGDDTFVFLCVGQWIRRKGFEEMLEAYYKEFSGDDDVILIIKTYGRDNTFPTMINIVNSIKNKSYTMNVINPPNVVVHGQMLTEEGMRKLYNSANCFILVSKGESWGLPYIQSMACGVPSIAQRYGGHLDYMNDGNSFLINPKEMRMTDGANWYAPIHGLKWAIPSIEEIRETMRYVVDNPNILKRKADKGLEDIKQWSWQSAAKKLADVITNVG